MKKNCTVQANKVVLNDLFPCAVAFCCGSKCSGAALPLRWLGASAVLQPRARALELGATRCSSALLSRAVWALATAAQTHRSVLAR